jgi:hypothetical protein
MTHTLTLRSDAEAEAAALRAVRSASTSSPTSLIPDQVPVTAIRASKQGPLTSSGAIFLVRVKIADASGRVLEEPLVPVQLKCPALVHGKKRRDVRRAGQGIHDRHQPVVVAAVAAHVSSRLTSLFDRYGSELARSMRREAHLARLAASEVPVLVQAGLFDRRAVKEHDSARRDETAASHERDARRRALQSAMFGIAMRGPDIVLLLLVNATS